MSFGRIAVAGALVAWYLLVRVAGASAADRTSTDIGIEAALVAGSHVGSENPDPVSGVVPAALLEVERHVGPYSLSLEGFPQVAASAGGEGPYGRSSASLSLLDATANAALGSSRRFRAGFGFQLVNLTNHNGNNGDRNSVRIASPIYAAGASLPLERGGVDLDVNVVPNLRGILHVFRRDGVAAADKPEVGAEIDYRVAYRWTRDRVTYRLGLRGLSYHTRNASSGDLVDRNVGGGAIFDVRFALGARSDRR